MTRTWVTARLPWSGRRVEPRSPSPRSVTSMRLDAPIARRVRAPRKGTCARRRARETASASSRSASLVLANASSPEVSLSMRCTTMQRRGRRLAPRVSPRRAHHVHRGAELALLVGHARDAGRLVDDDDVRVLEHDRRCRFRLGRRRVLVDDHLCPRLTRVAGSSAAAPSTSTLPRVHKLRARDHGTSTPAPPSRARTTAASVSPSSSSSMRQLCFTGGTISEGSRTP